MDPYLVAVAVSTFLGWGAVIAARKLPSRDRVEQYTDHMLRELKREYQAVPWEVPGQWRNANAGMAPAPFAALSVCPVPGCGYYGWHEMVEPDPSRRREVREEWVRTEPETVALWDGRVVQRTEPGFRLHREVHGIEESLLEVVRVCPECETRWGATSKGQVVW